MNQLEAAISLIFPSLDRLADSYKPIQEALSTISDQDLQDHVNKDREGYAPYYTATKLMVDEAKENVVIILRSQHQDFMQVGDYLDEGFLLIKEVFKTNNCTDDNLRSYIFEVNRNLSMVVTELAFTQNFYNAVIDIIPQTLYYSFPQAVQQALYHTEGQLDSVKRVSEIYWQVTLKYVFKFSFQVEFRQMLSDQQAYKDAADNAKWIVNGFTRHGYLSTQERLRGTIDKAVVGATKAKCRKAKKFVPTTKASSAVKQN